MLLFFLKQLLTPSSRRFPQIVFSKKHICNCPPSIFGQLVYAVMVLVHGCFRGVDFEFVQIISFLGLSDTLSNAELVVQYPDEVLPGQVVLFWKDPRFDFVGSAFAKRSGPCPGRRSLGRPRRRPLGRPRRRSLGPGRRLLA